MDYLQLTSHNRMPHIYSILSRRTHPIVTPRNLSYGLAGTLIFGGAVAVFNSIPSSTVLAPPNPKAQIFSTQQSATNTSPADTSSNSLPPPASTSVNPPMSNTTGPTPNVSVSVNGQAIPIPNNGSVQRTITSPDGSQTSVSVDSSTESQGNTTNTSSSSFSLNVTNNSSTGGSDTP